MPGSVDVGDWPSWSTDADRASAREGRGRPGQGRARDRPRRPVHAHPELRPARPAQRRRLAARGRRDPGRAPAQGARRARASRTGRSSAPACSPTRARSRSAAAPTGSYDYEEWENQRVAEGSATVALTMADELRRRTAVDARRRDRGRPGPACAVARPRGRGCSTPTPWCSPSPPARRATSTITGVSEARLTSLRRQRHAWAAKFVAAYDEPFWRATRAERAVGVRGRDRLDLAAAGGRAVRAGAARALRRVRGDRPGDPHPRGAGGDRGAVRTARDQPARRPGPGSGAPTRGPRATSRTGGPATSRRSGRCTAPTSRRSTSAAPTSGSPATWRARSAPGGPRPQQHCTQEAP